MTIEARHRRERVLGSCHRQTTRTWLRLVGPFTICRGGEPLPATTVGQRKARTLLGLLAVRRGDRVGLEDVVDLLWGATSPRNPSANVATLVSRLRASLGADIIRGGRSGYRLGEAVGTDLHDAERLINRAREALAAGNAQASAWSVRQALAMLDDGPLLADFPDARWIVPARVHHGALLRRARLSMATVAVRTGDPLAAREAAEAAVLADPMDEPAFRALMQALVASGEPAKALVVYGQLRATLADELGVEPSVATQDLHVAILRGSVALVPGEVRPLAG